MINSLSKNFDNCYFIYFISYNNKRLKIRDGIMTFSTERYLRKNQNNDDPST